jgi:hypothetical protein
MLLAYNINAEPLVDSCFGAAFAIAVGNRFLAV